MANVLLSEACQPIAEANLGPPFARVFMRFTRMHTRELSEPFIAYFSISVHITRAARCQPQLGNKRIRYHPFPGRRRKEFINGFLARFPEAAKAVRPALD